MTGFQDRPRSGSGRPGRGPGASRPPAPARSTTSRTSRTGASSASPAVAGEGRRPRLTRRALVVALVLAVLLVSYASSMRAYLQQRSHLSDLRSEIATSQAQVDALEKENDRWKDDGYVRSLARARLGWVLPGDTAYQVIDEHGNLLDSSDRLADPDEVVSADKAPWWEKQYSSLQKADHPPSQQRRPVGKITKKTPGE